MFFLFLNAREINRHLPCIPGLSKNFLKTKLKLAIAQTINFISKKSRHFNLIRKIYLIIIYIKQNFVRKK